MDIQAPDLAISESEKVIFPKCSKSRSNTRNGSASFIRIQRAQERQIPSSYEEMAADLPKGPEQKTAFHTTVAGRMGGRMEGNQAPKVASPDGILCGFRPRLFLRLPWPSRDVLGEDWAHLEPLDQRRDATSTEEAIGRAIIYTPSTLAAAINHHHDHSSFISTSSHRPHQEHHCCNQEETGREPPPAGRGHGPPPPRHHHHPSAARAITTIITPLLPPPSRSP